MRITTDGRPIEWWRWVLWAIFTGMGATAVIGGL